MKTIGIVVHSIEGGALSFTAACHEGERHLGPHMHPTIVLSAVPMGLSMPGWLSGNHQEVAEYLRAGVEDVAAAGADFYICPDNTAHIVLEQIAPNLPIPGLHIAEAVSNEISAKGWKRVGLLGTEWTMTGPVYPRLLEPLGMTLFIPDENTRKQLDAAIFDELCQGIFNQETTQLYVRAIEDLKAKGAECVILGCTEIPLIITEENSPLPILDSTRLQATYAVTEAVSEQALTSVDGWMVISGVSGGARTRTIASCV